MKRSFAAMVAVFLSSIMIVDAQDLPNEQEFAETVGYNTKAGEVIQAYLAVLNDATTLGVIMNAVAYDGADPATYDQQVSEIIAKAEQVRTSAEDLRTSLGTPPVSYLRQFSEQRDGIAPYINELSAFTRNQIAIWRRQWEALTTGKVGAYENLLAEELDGGVLILNGENALVRLAQTGISKSDPGYSLKEMIVHGNNALIAFIEFFGAFSTSLPEEDLERRASFFSAVSAFERELVVFDKKLSPFRKSISDLPRKARKDTAQLAECLEESRRTETGILRVLGVYGVTLDAAIAGTFDEKKQADLIEAERELALLSNQRVEAQQICAAIAQRVLAELR